LGILLGGCAIGATFFMRFSNVTIIPAAWVLIPLYGGWGAFRRRRAQLLVGTLTVAFAALLVFNTSYYGGPFDTGYSPAHGWYAQPAFSVSYAFGPSFVNGYSVIAVGQELLNALGVLLIFAVIGIITRPRREGLWLLFVTLVLLLPYGFYAFAAQGLNARFIIPALPAMSLLIGHGLVVSAHNIPKRVVLWTLSLVLIAAMLYRVPANVTALDASRQAAQNQVEGVTRWAAMLEPDAVVMSYTLNDQIAVYGHRSVLNYRHLTPYDPVTGKYLYTQFEPLLVDEVSQLLAEGVPVYYVFDQDPSLLKSYEILQAHFRLQLLTENPSIYRVQRKISEQN
jgi:4-amino-4-deoxy-L-arabinose transferase-like glycosyltransferase